MTSTDVPVLVDRRVGSAELYSVLQRRRVPVELTTLQFGDFAFCTASPTGEPIVVGIERKKIRDLVQSLHSGRLAGHQLPGLVDQYTHRWLVIEGWYRTRAEDGLIEVPAGRGEWAVLSMDALGLDRFLLTLELRGGCMIYHTPDIERTGQFVEAVWGWWTQKAWQKHRSHLALHRPPDVALFGRPTLVQRVAACLDGIGFERAEAVARAFPTVIDLAMATEAEWRRIPGIGKVLAGRIVHSLQTAKAG